MLPYTSMVVMEGVCATASAAGAGSTGSDPVTSAAHAAAHRSWYDQAAALQQATQGQGDEIDAYFKAGASNASSYFSQMQGAYSGMSSYHGNSNQSACLSDLPKECAN